MKGIDKLFRDGIIKKGATSYNSPVFAVPKKSDTPGVPNYRTVVDFRELNEQSTIRDIYPLSRIDEILDKLGKASHFSKLDLLSGYHQIPIRTEDQHKTGFTVGGESYYFIRTPFGFANSGQNFQRNMNLVLDGLVGTSCFVYLDDMIIFGKTPEHHHENLRKVFARLRQYDLRVKLSKCEFF